MKELLILLVLLTPLVAKPPLTETDIQSLRSYSPFSLSQKTKISPALRRHFKTYGTNMQYFHSFGHIIDKHDTLALFYFAPPFPKGIVIVVHGYFDNSGTLSSVTNYLSQKGYALLTLDLQGHGLSSGERAAIHNFRRYADAVNAVVTVAQESNLPIHTLGHSTGCTPMIDLLLRKEKPWDGETILIAPLVRSAMWRVSKVGAGILNPFTDETTRLFRNSSHDKLFKQSLKEDPLGIKRFPVSWSSALYAWNKLIEQRKPVDESILVIQGTSDGTVDWRYNLKFINKKFPNSVTHRINNGRHHLLNETNPYKQKTFDLIDTQLGLFNEIGRISKK